MRCVLCGNLEFGVLRSDLELLFGQYGKVEDIRIMTDFAFISFGDERDAENAIKNLDKKPFGCNDRRLSVKWSRDQDASGKQVVSENNVGMAIQKPLDDGYNWRKYGQKQVKGSEFPRSYYKCTHADCVVKKTVERTYNGQIIEIIYRGEHSHSISQPDLCSATGLPFSQNDLKNTEQSSIENSTANELSNPLSATSKEHLASSTLTKEDGSSSPTGNAADDYGHNEEHSTTRMDDTCEYEGSLASRHARAQKVVIQVKSTMDILEDGYRWRKYGQKVVKGNPNPRSYYKCTSHGCSVRKHVERVAEDMNSVLTTYEGKHNHEVPTGRNGQNCSGGGNNRQFVSKAPTSLPKNELPYQYIFPNDQTELYVNETYPSVCPLLDTNSNDPMAELAFHNYGGLNYNDNNFQHAASICSGLPEHSIYMPTELHEPCKPDLPGFVNVYGNPNGFMTESLSLQQQQPPPPLPPNDSNVMFLRYVKQEKSDFPFPILHSCLYANYSV